MAMEKQDVLLAVRPRCKCDYTDVRKNKRGDGFHCGCCGGPISFLLVEHSTLTMEWFGRHNRIVGEELIEENSRLKAETKELEEKNRNLTNMWYSATEESKSLTADNAALRASIESLNGYVTECDNLRNELELRVHESDSWHKAYSDIKVRMKTANEELSSLRAEASLFKHDLDEYRKIDIRSIVGLFLDYMSGINNALDDGLSTEELRGIIKARTDYVAMMSETYGVSIYRHGRGEYLGDGRMDIDTAITDDPELDRKVAKCRSYGCVFRDNALPGIPEKVTVWQYVHLDEDPQEQVADAVPEDYSETLEKEPGTVLPS